MKVFYKVINDYFKTLHPGKELFHIHCGNNGSASGGKTKFSYYKCLSYMRI